MKPQYLGDSYDIVKHSLLRWLGALGPWAAHPMFTEAVSREQADAFSALLGVPLISTAVLAQGEDRDAYFASARSCTSHLFLDPDTGVQIKSTRGKKAPAYLFVEELVRIANRQQRILTLVFDQSVQRGTEAKGLAAKLEALAYKGLHGFAYRSHACFLAVGLDAELVSLARNVLDREAHLPEDRLVTGPGA